MNLINSMKPSIWSKVPKHRLSISLVSWYHSLSKIKDFFGQWKNRPYLTKLNLTFMCTLSGLPKISKT